MQASKSVGQRVEAVKDRIGGCRGKCGGSMFFVFLAKRHALQICWSFLKKSVSRQSRLLDLQREVSKTLHKKLLKNLGCYGQGKSPYRAE